MQNEHLSPALITTIATLVTLFVVFSIFSWRSMFRGERKRRPRMVFIEIPLLAAYSAFFALITRAFMLLGVMEFFGHKS